MRAKVYRGWSVGGNVPAGGRDPRKPKVITRLTLTEISLVDRPANPEALFQLVKLMDNEPRELETPLSAIRKSLARPMPMAGDGGPLARRR